RRSAAVSLSGSRALRKVAPMPTSTPIPPDSMDDRTERVSIPSSPKTSVPDWTAGIPRLDERASSWSLLSLGAMPGGAPMIEWKDALTQHGTPFDEVAIDPCDLAVWTANLGSWFPRFVADRVVGWRIAIAGEEFAVLAVRAAALKAGLLECEIIAHVDSRDRFLVYCPDCRTHSLSSRDQDEPMRCQSCQRPLEVHRHVSRRLGSYLGSVSSPETGGH
ncbi:MAG TPA: dimethylamine monooxygenase subunit DmmA family protein, partial [Thermomicrobiales bacterium]|nr:dimethylamine monooxygenase subunit DmmA family protein [Thermomicrobiales bacterium]